MKKILTTFLICIVTSTFFLSGCGSSKLEITKIKFGKETNKNGRIDNPTTSFADNTEIIYGEAIYNTSDTETAGYVQVVWNRMDNDLKTPVDSTAIKVQGPTLLQFQSHRPGFSWPSGTYTIDFLLNEQILQSQNIEIVRESVVNCEQATKWIKNTQTTASVDSAHNATQPTTNFKTNTNQIYLVIATTKDIPNNQQIKIEWKYLTKSQVLSNENYTLNPNQQTHVTLDRKVYPNFVQSNGEWQPGQYQVKIELQPQCSQTLMFNIQ